MEKEIWKSVKGFEGAYEVSNLGKVRSVDRIVVYPDGKPRLKKGKELSQATSRGGYNAILICTQKERKNYLVHRLVAEAFIPNPENLPCINHKDENKHNNCVENLEWCTHQYNNNYGEHTKKIAKHFARPVIQLDMNGNFIARFESSWDAQRATGIFQGGICNVANHKKNSAGGFKWEWDAQNN